MRPDRIHRVVLVVLDGLRPDAIDRFDLRHLRYVPYLNNSEGLDKLARDLRPRLQQLAGIEP